MPEFLTTNGISDRLQKIIRGADEFLVLISPYLQTSPKVRELLAMKSRSNTHIRVIYGKRKLNPDERDWIESVPNIELLFRETLHAKCYLNEKEALLTSMNLYQFSEVNNDEMGILVSRRREYDSGRLYAQIHNEALHIARLSERIREVPRKRKERALGVKGLIGKFISRGQDEDSKESTAREPKSAVNSDSEIATDLEGKQTYVTASGAVTNIFRPGPGRVPVGVSNKPQPSLPATGFCIRCSTTVPANRAEPYCARHYRIWNEFKNKDYKEKVCHLCGNAEATTMAKPLCRNCYRTFKDAFV